MRWALTTMIVLAFLGGAEAAETEFPYTAYISADDVYVRSGPGKNYYPTCKLQRGNKVEVYRHDPGGWCAVRPPEGCFSWVSGRYVQVHEDGIGALTDDNVAARIGCDFSDRRDVVHVRLIKGQRVRILGESRFSTSESGVWYKISPPPGEFRWIHAQYVDPDYMSSGVRDTSFDGQPAVAEGDTPSSDQPTTDAPNPLPSNADGQNSDQATPLQPIAQQWTPVGGSNDSATSNTMDEVVAASASIQGLPPTEVVGSAPAQEIVYPGLAVRAEDDTVTARVKQLRAELAVMMAEEPTAWYFDELKKEAELLLTQSETAVQRGRVKLLLEAIERSGELQRRYEAVGELQEELEFQNRRMAAMQRLYDGAASDETNPASAFHAVGYLVRNTGAKAGDPPYVLVQQRADGAIIPFCYVSPSPGVNLAYYLRRPVGLKGVKNYLADRATHLVVREVQPVRIATRP